MSTIKNAANYIQYTLGSHIMQKIMDHPDYAILRFEVECKAPTHSYAYILYDVLRKMVEDHNDLLTLKALMIYMKDEPETLLGDANGMFHEVYHNLATKIEHLRKMEKP